MAAVLFRVVLLAVGMGAVEIGLGDALAKNSPLGWALVLLAGLPLVVAGSVAFMAPLLSGPKQKGSPHA